MAPTWQGWGVGEGRDAELELRRLQAADWSPPAQFLHDRTKRTEKEACRICRKREWLPSHSINH